MIYLNDILKFSNLRKVKLRFNLNFGTNRPCIEYFTDNTSESRAHMLEGQYWNYQKKGIFKVEDISLGFIPFPLKPDCWLLFHVGKVTKDLNVHNGVGYKFSVLPDYQKYVGRIVVHFKNKSQNLIRRGDTTMKDCIIEEILPNVYNNDIFPGYDKVNVSWQSLSILINKPSWATALSNQKGVYLLIDAHTGKKYIGAAYGKDMLLGRWRDYINTYHGNNKKLKDLDTQYIKDNFYFTILETYNGNVDDNIILEREKFWKDTLRTRTFGYNDN